MDDGAQDAHGGMADLGQLAEAAAERGDLEELRRLADSGSTDAVDILVEQAGERGDLEELRRLADSGSTDAVDILVEQGHDRQGPADEG